MNNVIHINPEVVELTKPERMDCSRQMRKDLRRRASQLVTGGMCPIMAVITAAGEFGWEVRDNDV